MCGIAGFAHAPKPEVIDRMADVQAHRGPDDRGARYFPEERVGLGQRRLSIIDLSAAGRQPMPNEDGRVWIVFAGEIYNYQELRAELERRGHRFRSTTDTETIVHLYEEDGRECIRRLNGMFALAILDRPRRRLVLARDRFGIKPLYWSLEHGRFWFATEIKGILAGMESTPDVDWQAAHDYFTYLYVPAPRTMFRGIEQLEPAHLLELDLDTRDVRLDRYWSLALGDGRPTGYSREAGAVLRDLLTDSVKRQQVSDVPLGVFLSGGIDSPVLTGLMASTSATRVKTFTVVFQGKGVEAYDERETARAVAERFGTEHHELPVAIDDPSSMLDLVRFFDQPFGNPTSYLMYLISRETRRFAAVALCGAGGDELFAGYPRYRALMLSRWLRRVPAPVRAAARGLMALAPDGGRRSTLHRGRQLLDGLDGDLAAQLVRWTYFLDEADKAGLWGPAVTGSNGCRFLPSVRIAADRLAASPFTDAGTRALDLDVGMFLPDNILEYTDKMSMAVSLEVRVPYLDHRVVEHAFAIPFSAKLRRGRGKVVLKDTFADLLPDAVRRAPKRGFNAPLGFWMRDRLDGYFDQVMDREAMERDGIFDWCSVARWRAEHRTGRRDRAHELFAVMMFDVWYRRYVLADARFEEALSADVVGL